MKRYNENNSDEVGDNSPSNDRHNWRQIISPLYDANRVGGGMEIDGHVETNFLGRSLIGRSNYQQHTCLRTNKLINFGGINQILLQIITKGNCSGDCNGNTINLNKGDIIIFDYSAPFNIMVSDGSTISIAFDRELISRIIDPRALNGAVIKGETSLGILLTSTVVSALKITEENAFDDPHEFEADILEYIAKLLSRKFDNVVNLHNIERQTIIDFIDKNIANHNLTPDFLYSNFNMSRSHIYRIFEKDGGVGQVIWERRLKLAWNEMAKSNSGQKISLKNIAWRFGCSDPAIFSKRFRSFFDFSPKDFKKFNFDNSHDFNTLSKIRQHFSSLESD